MLGLTLKIISILNQGCFTFIMVRLSILTKHFTQFSQETLQCYLTLLAFYLHMAAGLTSLTKLRSHPVRTRLLILREATQELNLLGLLDDSCDLTSESFEGVDTEDSYSTSSETISNPSNPLDVESLAEGGDWDKCDDKGSKTSSDILDEPLFLSNKRSFGAEEIANREDIYFGDPIVMNRSDAEDKRSRRKGLRFHVGRIDNSHLKTGVKRFSFGGYDDISLPQWKTEKVTTLKTKAAGMPPSPFRNKRPHLQELKEYPVEEEGDGYYDLIKRRKIAMRDARQETYETEKKVLQ